MASTPATESADERAFTPKGTSTRERVVAAARVALLEDGYDGLVLRELAASLDMKLGNLQYYFPTRDALVLHVLEIEGTRDADLVEERRRTDQPIDAFRFVVRDMADRYRGDSGRLLSMITALAQTREAYLKLYLDSYANFYPTFQRLLGDLRRDLSNEEVAMRARVVNALVEGSAFQTDVGDVEAFLDRIVTEAERIALRD
ncbi:MAG: TetR/AcrR family transcriptional regulator [Actinomycetota bacterium]